MAVTVKLGRKGVKVYLKGAAPACMTRVEYELMAPHYRPEFYGNRIQRLARQCGVYSVGKMLCRQGVPIRVALRLIQGV